VGRQGAPVRPSPGGASFTPVRLVLFGLRLAGGLDLLGLLQPELQLLLGQALGPPPKAIPLQLRDDLAQPFAFRALGQQHRLEQVGVVGEGFGARHDAE